MTEKNNMPTETKRDETQPQALQVKISMQPGEQTGQPIYSNLTSAQGGQGLVLVDFGFLEPQTMHALNRMVSSGEKLPGPINARMSCRMAISIDAANQLAQQLNLLLGQKTDLQGQAGQQNMTNQSEVSASSTATAAEGNAKTESDKSGFRFPWSKKTH
jgi:hypothetical protein